MFRNMTFSKFCIIVSLYFILIITLQNHVVGLFRVQGNSMLPNIHEGNIKIINHLPKSFDRGDIVVAKDYKDKILIIKRVVGLPGEKVDVIKDKVYINGRELEEPYLENKYKKEDDCIGNMRLENDEYFLMGDNRAGSVDSRDLGPFKRDDIIGRCF